MPGQQTEKSVKIPLQQPLSTRDGTLAKDSFMMNCYVEGGPESSATLKRPGLSLAYQLPAGVAQGQFFWGGTQYSIIGDVVYVTATGVSYSIPGASGGLMYDTFTPVAGSVITKGILKSTAGMWTMTQSGSVLTITKVTAVAYPATTVPGFAILDNTVYVMDTAGVIWGSALADPTTWPSLNFIGVDGSLGTPVALKRHMNYVVALMRSGSQLYYDAANATGSPLSAVTNASWTTGASAVYPANPTTSTAVDTQDTLYFVGKSVRSRAQSVIQMGSDLVMKPASDPFVDKILERSTLAGAYAYNLRTAGHSFYVLALPDLSLCLVMDTAIEKWYVWSTWTGAADGMFTPLGYTTDGVHDYLQDPTSGAVYQVLPTVYQDAGVQIRCLIRTIPYTWGTLHRKFIGELDLIADTVSATIQLRYSDDDYQTYSAYGAIDLSTVKKQFHRMGSTRRRSFDFLFTDNAPLRVYEAELAMQVGAQ